MLLKGIIATVSVVLGLCCFHTVAETKNVTLLLKWTHQFQFAGYYIAQEKGFYEEAGLSVNIVPAIKSDPDTFNKVLGGQAHFGVGHSGILQQRIDGKPLVAMASILQFSPYCWMVKQSSDIFHPHDFQNKRVSSISTKESAELLVMLEQSGIDTKLLPVYHGIDAEEEWLNGELDAIQVYVTNEPFQMLQKGIEHRLICPQKYGINVYSDILYTTEGVLAENPQMVEKFYKASLKGWRYAMMHLEESIAVTAEKYATHKSINELTNEAEVLSDYILPPDTKLGAMSMPKWRLIADLYQLEEGSFDKVKVGFIYRYDVPEKMELSWMLIAAIALSILFLPLYLRLMFKKSV